MSDKIAAEIAKAFDKQVQTTDDLPRKFTKLSASSYELTVDYAGISFFVDYLRRERGQLICELRVRCNLPGVKTYKGTLSQSDINFSSATVRSRHAKLLQVRSDCPAVPWDTLLEELVQRVTEAERKGSPSVELGTVDKPPPYESLMIDGIPIMMRHPMILFGDGGTGKSLLGLYLAGRLSIDHGVRVGLFDWELAAEDHRERLENIFGPEMPYVCYARCDRPLYYESDRLRRIVRDDALDYVVIDSIAFACDGPPESAEVAGRYFQATRQLGIVGSLHIAHVTKAVDADTKPFGSAFWHNGARSTWNIKASTLGESKTSMTVGLYNKKANLGGMKPAVGYEIAFDAEATTFRTIDLRDIPDLATSLPLSQRIRSILLTGAMTREDQLETLGDAKAESVRRVTTRAVKKGTLVRFPGPGGDKYGVPAHHQDD